MTKNKKNYKESLASAMESLPTHDSKAHEDAYIYTSMSADDLSKLPNFNPDGSVKFYELGSVLLGKTSLLKFIETIKNR